ncbi:unnamed protein product [Closterium sp. Naga37s-1]|nr:unnamed protein product [Closterium sp. Naga37s-1]
MFQSVGVGGAGGCFDLSASSTSVLDLKPVHLLVPLCFAALRLCLLVMPVAVGGGSPVPYSPRPFGVASAALASTVVSAPVAPVAAMSAAGSPAHACSMVVDSGRESAGVDAPPRVVAPAPVPAFVLAHVADVAPLPAPGAAPSPAPLLPALPSPAAAAADAAVAAPASGVTPPPAPVLPPPPVAPVALPVAAPAASLGAPGGGSALPLPWLPRLHLSFHRLCSSGTPVLIRPLSNIIYVVLV